MTLFALEFSHVYIRDFYVIIIKYSSSLKSKQLQFWWQLCNRERDFCVFVTVYDQLEVKDFVIPSYSRRRYTVYSTNGIHCQVM
jgi:hypothetical protein